jgi:hypothetical protein
VDTTVELPCAAEPNFDVGLFGLFGPLVDDFLSMLGTMIECIRLLFRLCVKGLVGTVIRSMEVDMICRAGVGPHREREGAIG